MRVAFAFVRWFLAPVRDNRPQRARQTTPSGEYVPHVPFE